MSLRLAAAAALLLVSGCEARQPAAPAAASAVAPKPARPIVELGPWLQQQSVAGRFSGVVLVAQGDSVLFRQAYGLADRAANTPMTPQARFRIASLSKQFTAAAVLRLHDRGVLDIDDSVCRWIAPCPDAWRPVTLHHLLSHTSGIPDLMSRPDWSDVRWSRQTPASLTAASAALPLLFPPGERAEYSNAGFNLLGSVVERATGQPFAVHLRASLLEPLGLTDTGWDDGSTALAVGYSSDAPQRGSNAGVVFAAGGLYSSAEDLFRWTRALHSGRVVSPASYARMIAAANPERYRSALRRGVPQTYGYGLFIGAPGLRVQPGFDDRQIFHTGSWAGFRAFAAYQPETAITVVALANDFGQDEAVLLAAQRAMAEALGRALPDAVASEPHTPEAAAPAAPAAR